MSKRLRKRYPEVLSFRLSKNESRKFGILIASQRTTKSEFIREKIKRILRSITVKKKSMKKLYLFHVIIDRSAMNIAVGRKQVNGFEKKNYLKSSKQKDPSNKIDKISNSKNK